MHEFSTGTRTYEDCGLLLQALPFARFDASKKTENIPFRAHNTSLNPVLLVYSRRAQKKVQCLYTMAYIIRAAHRFLSMGTIKNRYYPLGFVAS